MVLITDILKSQVMIGVAAHRVFAALAELKLDLAVGVGLAASAATCLMDCLRVVRVMAGGGGVGVDVLGFPTARRYLDDFCIRVRALEFGFGFGLRRLEIKKFRRLYEPPIEIHYFSFEEPIRLIKFREIPTLRQYPNPARRLTFFLVLSSPLFVAVPGIHLYPENFEVVGREFLVRYTGYLEARSVVFVRIAAEKGRLPVFRLVCVE